MTCCLKTDLVLGGSDRSIPFRDLVVLCLPAMLLIFGRSSRIGGHPAAFDGSGTPSR